MTDRELLEKIASQVGALTNHVETLTERVDGLQNEMQEGFKETYKEMQEGFREAYNERQELKTEIRDIKETVIKIEDEQKQKFGALFDGYKQNSDILERIEKEVSKHEEIILRRVQ